MKTWLAAFSVAAGRLGGFWGASAYLGAALFVSAAAFLQRRFSPEDAVDVTLTGAVFGWTIPLLAYAAVARVSKYGRLDDGATDLVRHGGDRRAIVASFVLMTAARVAVVGALLAALGVLISSVGEATAIRADALTSAWVGGLGGAAYVAWFSLGSLWGKAGRGRLLSLVLDWVLGATSTAAAVPWPRAHLRCLLGGELVVGLPAWQSSALLGLLAGLYYLACLLRVAR
jgi:hypothetical protein